MEELGAPESHAIAQPAIVRPIRRNNMINVIRARKDIRPRSIISYDLLEEALLPDSAFTQETISRPEQAIGKVARHLIFQGQQIKLTDLEEEQQVSA